MLSLTKNHSDDIIMTVNTDLSSTHLIVIYYPKR